MNRRNWAKALAGLILAASPGMAGAQQAIVCYTLQTELTMFDRRAKPFDQLWRQIQTLQGQADQASQQFRAECLSPVPQVDCEAISNRATAVETELYSRMQHYAHSPAGGADPVRQALVAEQMRQGCLWRQDGNGETTRLDPATMQPKGVPLKRKY